MALIDSRPLPDFRVAAEIDRLSQSEGLTSLQLMGQAALATLGALRSSAELTAKPRRAILLLCGPGNNGGDGYALAYHLLSWSHQWRNQIRVFYYISLPKSEAAAWYHRQVAMLLEDDALLPLEPWCEAARRGRSHELWQTLSSNTLVVDALFGSGQRSTLEPGLAALLSALGSSSLETLSLDHPTGVGEGTLSDDFPFRPHRLHCYGLIKRPLISMPDLFTAADRVVELPIGFTPASLNYAKRESARLLTPRRDQSEREATLAQLFRRDALGHKYRSGAALALGGSSGMEGAILLAADAFFAAGGGLLRADLPGVAPNDRVTLLSNRPNLMLSSDRFDSLGCEAIRRSTALLIGPGLSPAEIDESSSKTQYLALLKRFQNDSSGALILDAAATRLILDPDFPEPLRRRTILTPHAGEWHALAAPPFRCSDDLPDLIDWLDKHTGASLLLKGPTLLLVAASGIATAIECGVDGEKSSKLTRAAALPLASTELAQAGSGDTLGGILLAICARNDKNNSNSNLFCSVTALHEKVAAAALLLFAAAEEQDTLSASSFAAAIRHQLLKGKIKP